MLLGKSVKDINNLTDFEKENFTLYSHTFSVYRNAKFILNEILNEILKENNNILYNLKLDIKKEEFIKLVLFSALIHDFGKANNHYQNFIKYGNKQFIRHEHLTLLLFSNKKNKNPLYGFLYDEFSKVKITNNKNINDIYFNIAIIAAFAHHLKTDHTLNKKDFPFDQNVEVYLNDSCIKSLIKLINKLFETDIKTDFKTLKYNFINDQEISFNLQNDYETILEDHKQLLSVVKSIIIAADTLGSALTFSKEQKNNK
jgi:CRISPR-associated endonuclease Cas3-HD